MTGSVFPGLTTALQALLVQSPAVAGGRVWRGRLKPLAQEHDSAAVLMPIQANGTRGPMAGGPVQWDLVLGVACYARATPGQDPEDAVDVVLRAAYARLLQATTSISGLVDIGADPQIEWDTDEADTSLACATLHLHATLITQAATLNAWP